MGAYEAVRDASGRIVDFTIVYVNGPGAACVGVPADEQIGRRLCELFPQVRATGYFDKYCAVVDTGVPLVEPEMERSASWWEMRVSRLGDGFLGVWRDITDRIRMEEALRARAEELAVLMDATPAAVWIALDAECRVIHGSREAHEVLRMPAGSNLSMTPGQAPRPTHFRVLEHGVELTPEQLPVQRAARGEEVRNFEEEVVFDGGDRVFLYGNAIPLRGPDGAPRGAISAFVDITAHKRVEEELRQARAAAEAANAAKDEFLATVSHELRTPLTAVMGYLRMLQQGAVPPERVAEVLETISRNANLQLQVIDDILDVASFTQGKLALDVARLHLQEALLDALNTVRPVAAGKGVELSHAVDVPVTVLADARRLHQVLWNVLANAVKFTPAGGRVRVALDAVGGHAEITVADTGVGIAPEFLPRVFERFTQGTSGATREQSGLGLGLAIAHRLVTAHGGTIDASSGGKGRGATFVIRLPCDP